MKTNLKIISLLLILVLLLPFTFVVNASEDKSQEYAEYLYYLGLLKKGDNGFDLTRETTRIEAVIMLIRLMGKENDVMSMPDIDINIPYTDVPKWAERYVAYAYANKLTNGISKDKFGTDEKISVEQYVTFILRALGYDDKAGDFQWEKSLEKAEKLGMKIDKNSYKNKKFLRADMIELSYLALDMNIKNLKITLIEKLEKNGVIIRNIKKVGTRILIKAEFSSVPYVKTTGSYVNISDLKAAFYNLKYIVQIQYNNDNANENNINYFYKDFYLRLKSAGNTKIKNSSYNISKPVYINLSIDKLYIPDYNKTTKQISYQGANTTYTQGHAFLFLDKNYDLLGYVTSGSYIESEKKVYIETSLPFDQNKYKQIIEKSIADRYKDAFEIKCNVIEYNTQTINLIYNYTIIDSTIVLDTTNIPDVIKNKMKSFECIGVEEEKYISLQTTPEMLDFISLEIEKRFITNNIWDELKNSINVSSNLTLHFNYSYMIGEYPKKKFKYMFIAFIDDNGNILCYAEVINNY